jgi:seryl-tRNA synthetase
MTEDQGFEEFQRQLLDAGILVAAGVDGLYGRSRDFETVVAGVVKLVDAWGQSLGATRFDFPPVVWRGTFERTNYLESFPNLIGSIHVFTGDDRDHAELLRRLDGNKDWPELLTPADVVMSSAACHSLYPLCTGTLPEEGRRFTVLGYCFRHEPSIDPARMQSFRMQEVVYVGDADAALAHRDDGLEYGLAMLERLGLDMEAVPANDPFFGRAGTVLAAGQLQQELKMEGVTPICSVQRPTAIMSANYHLDHFGVPFAIETADGKVAHSACVAFGIERITLALFHHHGLDLGAWPAPVREALGA